MSVLKSFGGDVARRAKDRHRSREAGKRYRKHYAPEIGGKHECVKASSRVLYKTGSPARLAPAYPSDSRKIIKTLKEALDRAELLSGGEIEQKRFGELLGLPKSTVNDWMHGRLVEQIERFVCALERLDDTARLRFLRQICRPCPRLSDGWFSHDQAVVTGLTATARQLCGLTFVSGPVDMLRTYVVTAIGNSAAGMIRACGFDVHNPKTFVPIPGVFYLENPCSQEDLRKIVHAVWTNCNDCDSPLVVLNGVWNAAPELQSEIISAAKHKHVLVTDDFGGGRPQLTRKAPKPSTLIYVDKHQAPGNRLLVRIEALAK